MNPKPNIVILATGGTIASPTGDVTGEHYGYANIPVTDLVQSVPALHQIANIRTEQIVQIDSSAMTQAIWIKLAKRTAELAAQSDVDGIVITHGTDTAEETAYFLSLTIPTTKAIVLTGAMRPAASLSADGMRNLYNAVVVAAAPQSRNKGVLLAFNDAITTAREVTKTNVSSTDSFRSPEFGLLGYVYGNRAYFYKQPTYRHTANSEFNIHEINDLPKVDIIYGYADNNPCVVDALIKDGVAGIISAGVGKGLQPPAMTAALIRARQQGILVVRSSRGISGIITPEPDFDDLHQFVAANTLSPQKARILLALALMKTKSFEKIQIIFDTH